MYFINCSSCFFAHRVLSIRCVYIAFSWRIDRQTIKINKISVPVMLQLLLLLLIGVMLILTSAKDSLIVVSGVIQKVEKDAERSSDVRSGHNKQQDLVVFTTKLFTRLYS